MSATVNSNKKSKKVNPKPKVKVFQKKIKRKEPESIFIQKLQEEYDKIESEAIKSFNDLPLSPKTLKGLKECGYSKPTEIQRDTIKLALTGKDVLGAAQTGSGKTLAFLIPILEKLFCKQWTNLDGLGALVITPTRELAYQIFEALRRIGGHHDFSAGLIIGGKDLKFERNRMDQCNIIICTPGRLLQHMDENPLFDAVNLQILVLDEADRCLDLGFEQTVNAIIANLPPKRQTFLFSATQTKSVRDLARLSLKDPSYISVHEHSEFSTPKQLQQTYVVCELKDKISILWSFIKNHLKQKIIIFFASCKEVKYVNEIFCKLRPGSSLMALYGTLHQLRRMEIYESFSRKQSAVLFATDIAARGLDFPEVHWVVQADCPEDAATYIHRVGRTARYHRGGESLLLLIPSEVAMIEELKDKKIPIKEIDVNPLKLNDPVRKMEAFLARDTNLKDSAQRAFVNYFKSIFLMKNKKVFNVQKIDTDSFANSLGLAIPPRIRFLQRLNAGNNNKTKNIPATSNSNKKYFNDEDEKMPNEETNQQDESLFDGNEVSDKEETFTENKPNVFHVSDDSDNDSNDGILKVKRQDHDIELPTEAELKMNQMNNSIKKPITRAAVVKKILKKKIVQNKKIIFDDDGGVVAKTGDKKSQMALEYENEDEGGIDIERARLVLREEDKFDKQLFKEKVKSKHKEEKRKAKESKLRREEEEDEFGESDSEADVDLSWLPDPDKLYGIKNESDEEAEFFDPSLEKNKFHQKTSKTADNDEERLSKKAPKDNRIAKKRKSNSNKSELPMKKKKKNKLKLPTNVNDAEELAMLLLKNK